VIRSTLAKGLAQEKKRQVKMSDSEAKVVTLPNVQQIEAEAAAWMTVLGRDCIGDEDRAEFKRWLRQSERHRATFEALGALWDDLEVLKELDDIGEAMSRTSMQRVPLVRKRGLIAAAASLAMAIVAAGALYIYDAHSLVQTAAFATGIGEQRTVELTDGSTIQLNTNTRVQVLYSRSERLVQLERGEAHFDVAKNKRRPFSVSAGNRLVKAVGTAFTVRRRDNDVVEVTVEEGTVALASLSTTGALIAQERIADRSPLAQLTSGQSVVFDDRVETIRQLPEPEIRRKLAWRQGALVYSGEPLAEVVAEISRYTDITIEIADPALAAKPVAGYFPVSKIEGLFQSLEINFGIHVDRVDATHVRLSSSSGTQASK
jgi:transmembrane sensor